MEQSTIERHFPKSKARASGRESACQGGGNGGGATWMHLSIVERNLIADVCREQSGVLQYARFKDLVSKHCSALFVVPKGKKMKKKKQQNNNNNKQGTGTEGSGRKMGSEEGQDVDGDEVDPVCKSRGVHKDVVGRADKGKTGKVKKTGKIRVGVGESVGKEGSKGKVSGNNVRKNSRPRSTVSAIDADKYEVAVTANAVDAFIASLNRRMGAAGVPLLHIVYSKWEKERYVVRGREGLFEEHMNGVNVPQNVSGVVKAALGVICKELINENGRMNLKVLARRMLKGGSVPDKKTLNLLFTFLLDMELLQTSVGPDAGGHMYVWFGPRLLALDSSVKSFYTALPGNPNLCRGVREYAFSVGSDEENFEH